MQQVEIRVKGQIDQEWSNRFGGLIITYPPKGESIITGSIRDQSELRGMLCWLTDLGLEIVSLTTIPRAYNKNHWDKEVIYRRKMNNHYPGINNKERREK